MQETITFEEAAGRLRALLAEPGRRRIIGIVGKPGAGKSHLANWLLGQVPAEGAVVIPMDGYHLSNRQLARLGRSDRKGAPDTFDADGFAALLRRVRDAPGTDVYFPIFHREIEESVSAEGLVPADCRLVLTEGNYLLHDDEQWRNVSELLDECWYVDVPDSVRMTRLVSRHRAFGKSADAADTWANGPDERNARLIEQSRPRAHYLLRDSTETAG